MYGGRAHRARGGHRWAGHVHTQCQWTGQGDSVTITVGDRLAQVDRLLDGTVNLGNAWPQTSGWLLRLALEQALADLWRSTAPPMVDCSFRAQLLALPIYVAADIAADAAELWHALSQVAHHRDYELARQSMNFVAGRPGSDPLPKRWPPPLAPSTCRPPRPKGPECLDSDDPQPVAHWIVRKPTLSVAAVRSLIRWRGLYPTLNDP